MNGVPVSAILGSVKLDGAGRWIAVQSPERLSRSIYDRWRYGDSLSACLWSLLRGRIIG